MAEAMNTSPEIVAAPEAESQSKAVETLQQYVRVKLFKNNASIGYLSRVPSQGFTTTEDASAALMFASDESGKAVNLTRWLMEDRTIDADNAGFDQCEPGAERKDANNPDYRTPQEIHDEEQRYLRDIGAI